MDVLTGIKTLISSIPQNIINLISNQNTEVVWFIMLLLCFFSILVFLKLFGYVGLYVYSAIAIIAANIQVLKQANFNFFSSINEKIIPFYEPSPIALGKYYLPQLSYVLIYCQNIMVKKKLGKMFLLVSAVFS